MFIFLFSVDEKDVKFNRKKEIPAPVKISKPDSKQISMSCSKSVLEFLNADKELIDLSDDPESNLKEEDEQNVMKQR